MKKKYKIIMFFLLCIIDFLCIVKICSSNNGCILVSVLFLKSSVILVTLSKFGRKTIFTQLISFCLFASISLPHLFILLFSNNIMIFIIWSFLSLFLDWSVIVIPFRLWSNNKEDFHKIPGKMAFLISILANTFFLFFLLICVAYPKLIPHNSWKKDHMITLHKIEQLESVLELYYLDNGYYPATEIGLKVLITTKRESNEVYIDNVDSINDAWGREFIYKYPGSHNTFDIISYGADGIPGGVGKNSDIINSTFGEENHRQSESMTLFE